MDDAALTTAERRLDLKAGTFPFASRWLSIAGATLHHVDEGEGPLVLMLHGNPTWSVLYRDLIERLKGSYRCVALDLAGFGLSQAPHGFSFLPEDHAGLVTRFIERLDLRGATLVAHDWGGPIGLAAMTATQGRITRLCLGNTWAWPVNGDWHFEWFSRFLGGPVGRLLAYRYAIFINGFMPTTMRRRKLTADEMATYRAPFRSRETRRPMHVFPAAITGSREFLRDLEGRIRGFRGPVRMIWPENDVAFRDKELSHWLDLLPQADVVRIPRCGHFPWLDAADECGSAVRAFMEEAINNEPAPIRWPAAAGLK